MKTIATQSNTEHGASWPAGALSARVLSCQSRVAQAFSVEKWPLVLSDAYLVSIFTDEYKIWGHLDT